ncbi:unnamed protein product [Prorocentrum cordatum]|uniref:Uncharacterized protein n=1 Tax=Prorocentrum cordatum TaxID=2364126 RepID=A0ABN9XW51_9DINO|nr:unnamed protein product [Polarella glacialis]
MAGAVQLWGLPGWSAGSAEIPADLATLAKEQAQMDEVRRETHADYLKAKADLEQGLEGVRKALSVLREYYGNAAAMLQQGDDQPSMPAQHSKGEGGNLQAPLSGPSASTVVTVEDQLFSDIKSLTRTRAVAERARRAELGLGSTF